MHPERITQNGKKLVNDLDYDEVGFPVREKNVFYYENKLTFPIYISDQKFENSIDLLLVIDEKQITLCLYQRF